MRALEFIVAIVVALVIFAALKIMGWLLHAALIGAAVGFGIGLAVTFLVRRRD